LICFHRYDSGVDVPGCSSSRTIEDDTIDFCIDPIAMTPAFQIPVLSTNVEGSDIIATSVASNATQVELIIPQNTMMPPGSPRLQKCQGDCDEDLDCGGVLRCFQRVSNEPVPGCTGYEEYRTVDFCYDPNDVVADVEPEEASNNDPGMICLYQCKFRLLHVNETSLLSTNVYVTSLFVFLKLTLHLAPLSLMCQEFMDCAKMSVFARMLH
jgi:hypothetical protein